MFEHVCAVTAGCDNPRFLDVPDWYANDCCRVLALERTQCVLSQFIQKVQKEQVSEKYIHTTMQSTSTCLNTISPIIYQLNYGIEYLGLGKVVWHQQKVKPYADSKSTAYLSGTWLKTKKYQTVILAYLGYVSA